MTRLLDNDVVTASNSLDAISDSNFEPYSTTEEPQVGFRWTSQEIFQEAMRYGRRSKLEFLWRLGAVPRSRNLDQRTLPWETSDRSYLTADSFASIHSDDKAAQFAPAGWVYRLFSGDRHQEVTSASANSLRNMNRIKGIVSYLESLDEQLSRGKVCSSGLVSQSCGFRQSSTFVWDLLYLRQLRAGVRNDSTDALERLLQLALDIEHRPINSTDDIETMATSAATQAILAYLTDDFELAQKTAEAIFEALLPTPRVLLHQTEIAASRVSTEAVISLDGEGYSFPVLPPSRRLESRLPLWTILIHPDADLTQVHMPFSPLTFDPSILLDALRLLDTMHHHMPNRALHSLFSVQLAYLLQARTVLETKNLPLDEARAYDLKVASLAAYLDDVRLLNRIRDRAHLRSSDHQADPELLTRLGHVGLGEEALGDTHVVWDGLIDGRR